MQTGGIDLISVPPNGVITRRKESSLDMSEESFLAEALRRVGQEAGCSVNSIMKIEQAVRVGGRNTIEYLMLTDCN